MKHKNLLFFLLIFLWNNLAFSQVQNDSTFIQSRKFEDFKEKYADSEFNYLEQPRKVDTTAWERFWSAVGRFFRNLFDCLSKRKEFILLK